MVKKYIFMGTLIVLALYYLFYLLGTINVTAQFNELEPFPNHLPVYYKGFRMGRTVKVYPGPDYTTTRVDMRLKSKNLKLPENTTVILKRKDKRLKIGGRYVTHFNVHNKQSNNCKNCSKSGG